MHKLAKSQGAFTLSLCISFKKVSSQEVDGDNKRGRAICGLQETLLGH